ncbi:MAG: DUF4339 domain-containing protein, partial [Sphingobacteriales bacterium]
MSERYYLLRNNRESGPFTLDELLQQCLLPGDLVWAEGRSQNWTAPYDLPEVQSALPKGYSLSPAEPVHFEHISDREQALRAESLRRRALAALYQQHPPVHLGTARPEMQTNYPPLADPEDLEIVHHKPERSRGAVPEFLLFCTLSALVVVGWRGGVFAHLIQVRRPVTEVASQSLSSESSHAARALSILPQPAAVQSALPVPVATDTLQQQTDSAALVQTAAPLRHSTPKAVVSSTVTSAPETTSIAPAKPAETTAAATQNKEGNSEQRRDTNTASTTSNSNNTTAGSTTKDKEEKTPVTAQA